MIYTLLRPLAEPRRSNFGTWDLLCVVLKLRLHSSSLVLYMWCLQQMRPFLPLAAADVENLIWERTGFTLFSTLSLSEGGRILDRGSCLHTCVCYLVASSLELVSVILEFSRKRGHTALVCTPCVLGSCGCRACSSRLETIYTRLDSTRSQSKANEFSPRGLLVMDASLDLTSSSQQSQVSTVAPKVKWAGIHSSLYSIGATIAGLRPRIRH